MELLEESQAVIVDHRGFSPRMDVENGGHSGDGGGGARKTERDGGLNPILVEKKKPASWADFIRENIQRFRLF